MFSKGNKRSVIAFIMLSIVAGIILVSLIYPTPTRTTQDTMKNVGMVGYEDQTEFTVSSTYRVDGDLVYANNLMADSDIVLVDEKIKFGDANLDINVFKNRSSSGYYWRGSFSDREKANAKLDNFKKDTEIRILRVKQQNNKTTIIAYRNKSYGGPLYAGINSLRNVSYKEVGSKSGTRTLSPEPGFYAENYDDTYHIGRTSGTITVDTERNHLRSGNVSWKLTYPAGTFMEYLYTQQFHSQSIVNINYVYDKRNVSPTVPVWVTNLENKNRSRA